MSDETKDQLRSHAYDGIQEYENQLPRWWVYLFVITIIFSGFYLYYYHLRGVPAGLEAEYQSEQKAAEHLAMAQPNPADSITEESLLALVKDAKVVSQGKTIFAEKCAACHGASGEGLVGPNLTDDFWIHGGSMKNMVHTIRVGVPEKGMIPWGGMLKDDEIFAVAAFIRSIHGTNPPNGKAPEGQKESF